MRKILSFSIITTAILILYSACANTGVLTGGEKDTLAPVPLKFIPLFGQTNFTAQKVKIKFHEYFELNDIANQFIVSPPLENKPDVKVKGKWLEIKITDTLANNTTYNFDFNDALRDYAEHNVLHGFQYICSTGAQLDTLMISGRIVDAQTLEPVENAMVFLYRQLNDTTPETVLPDYLARTNKDGYFSVRNISQTKYYVFALKDDNLSLLYDQESEKIAFLDKQFFPTVKKRSRVDTLRRDSIFKNKETKEKDTIEITETHKLEYFEYKPDSLELFLFDEDNYNQFLVSENRQTPGNITIKMNRPISSSYKFNFLDFPGNKNYILETNEKNDSLIYWLKDTALINKDTLRIQLTYKQMDSLKLWQDVSDTLSLGFDFEDIKEEKPGKQKSDLQIKMPNLSSGFINKGENFDLKFNIPIAQINKNYVKLWSLVPDSATKYLGANRKQGSFKKSESAGIQYAERQSNSRLFLKLKKGNADKINIKAINFKFASIDEHKTTNGDTIILDLQGGNAAKVDTLNFVAEYNVKTGITTQPFADTMFLALKRSPYEVFGQREKLKIEKDTQDIKLYHVKFKGKNDNTGYYMLVEPKAFTDIFNNKPDSISFNFKIRPDDYYANLIIHLKNATSKTQFILIDKNGEIVKETKTTHSEILKINQLSPGNYTLRAFEDKNSNGKWDTGDFKKRLQPEKVYLYSKDIVLKSAWDTEEDWDLLQKIETKKLKK